MTEPTPDGRPVCGHCLQRIPAGRAEGGWAASGPGIWYHRDETECGPPVPVSPLPVPHLSPAARSWRPGFP